MKSRLIGADVGSVGANNVFKATFCSVDPLEVRAWIGTFESKPYPGMPPIQLPNWLTHLTGSLIQLTHPSN